MNLSDTIHQQTKFNYFLHTKKKKKKLNLIIANAFSSQSLSLSQTHTTTNFNVCTHIQFPKLLRSPPLLL